MELTKVEHDILIDDMLREILLRVNNIDLCRCRWVNHRWRRFTLQMCKPITWKGEYIECCRKGDLLSITTGNAVRYYHQRFVLDAAQSGSWDMIHYFGFPFQNNDFRTVLLHACMGDNIELIRLLVTKYKMDILSPVIKTAIKHGNIEIVKFLLEQRTMWSQAYVLYVKSACEYGHREVAELLIQSTTLYGFPVYECCHGGLTELVKKIKFDGDNDGGDNLWLNIGIGGSREIISHFSKTCDINYDKLVSGAISRGHLDLVKEYLPKISHPINTDNIIGAVKSGKMDMLKYLLSHVVPSTLDIGNIFGNLNIESALLLYDVLFDFLYDYMKEPNIRLIGTSASITDYYPITIKCYKWCQEHIPTTTTRHVDMWYKVAAHEKSYAVIDYLNNIQ